ncbi:hypothetical protein [Shewanella sp. YIC-542]|uniref:hypothetical protein n=1 Tax=Shewanella mytili TaxID=3377111 RepID=UPI00398F49D2
MMQWITRLLMVAALLLAVWLFVRMSDGFTVKRHRTDQQLITSLTEQQSGFMQLMAMFRQDGQLFSINSQFMDPDKAIDKVRWQQYRQHFTQLSLEGGIRTWGAHGVMFVSSVISTPNGISTKGYVYRPHNPLPRYTHLDRALSGLPYNTVGYRKIDEDWYLFYLKYY